MNGIRPTVGIEFDDKYTNAKNKLLILKSKAFKLTLFTLTHHLQVVPITQRKYIFVEIRK